MAAADDDQFQGPWLLMTPAGGQRVLGAGELSLKNFAKELDDKLHNVKVFVDWKTGNVKEGKVKQHIKNFQLWSNVVWIRRTDTGEVVPIVGGAAKYFMEHFGKRRNDMPFEQPKLQALMNGGIRVGGKKTSTYKIKHESFDWELCESAPLHSEQLDWTSPTIWCRVRGSRRRIVTCSSPVLVAVRRRTQRVEILRPSSHSTPIARLLRYAPSPPVVWPSEWGVRDCIRSHRIASDHIGSHRIASPSPCRWPSPRRRPPAPRHLASSPCRHPLW